MRYESSGIKIQIRLATISDIPDITAIYNQAIESGLANFERHKKSVEEMISWLKTHCCNYPVLVAEIDSKVYGYAALHQYASSCCNTDIVEFTTYINKNLSNLDVEVLLLSELVDTAAYMKYHKLISNVLETNIHAKQLLNTLGFEKAGTLKEQVNIDGLWHDVVIMEKLLSKHTIERNVSEQHFMI